MEQRLSVTVIAEFRLKAMMRNLQSLMNRPTIAFWVENRGPIAAIKLVI
jgi:hypothetical protein